MLGGASPLHDGSVIAPGITLDDNIYVKVATWTCKLLVKHPVNVNHLYPP